MPKSPSDQRDGATYLGLVGLAYAAGLDRVRRVVGTGLAAERVDRDSPLRVQTCHSGPGFQFKGQYRQLVDVASGDCPLNCETSVAEAALVACGRWPPFWVRARATVVIGGGQRPRPAPADPVSLIGRHGWGGDWLVRVPSLMALPRPSDRTSSRRSSW
jgi:hypothetical protein